MKNGRGFNTSVSEGDGMWHCDGEADPHNKRNGKEVETVRNPLVEFLNGQRAHYFELDLSVCLYPFDS